MSPRPYNAKDVEPVVVQMNREIKTLLTERSTINRRIDMIRKALVGLATLMGEEGFKETLQPGDKSRRVKNGITRTCRMVLMNSGTPLMAKDLYERICLEHPTLLASHSAPIMSLYAVLGRLVKRGEARIVADVKGRRCWQWIQQPSAHVNCQAVEPADSGISPSGLSSDTGLLDGSCPACSPFNGEIV